MSGLLLFPVAKPLMPTPLPRSPPCPRQSASISAALIFLKRGLAGGLLNDPLCRLANILLFWCVCSDGASVSPAGPSKNSSTPKATDPSGFSASFKNLSSVSVMKAPAIGAL